MITEKVTFQLRADASLADPSSPASRVIRDFLAPELAAHGAHHAYYGQFIEKTEMVIIFVEWDSIDDHKKFMKSPASFNWLSTLTGVIRKAIVKPTSKHLRTIVSDKIPVTVLHVPFTPSDDPSPSFGADGRVGATEVVFFYFPSDLNGSDKDAIMSSVAEMRPVMERSEALAVYDGWALEGAVPDPVGSQTGEGETRKVYVNVVGWVDVDAHMRFQASEDFRQNIHHLMGAKNMRHTELYHAKLYAV